MLLEVDNYVSSLLIYIFVKSVLTVIRASIRYLRLVNTIRILLYVFRLITLSVCLSCLYPRLSLLVCTVTKLADMLLIK